MFQILLTFRLTSFEMEKSRNLFSLRSQILFLSKARFPGDSQGWVSYQTFACRLQCCHQTRTGLLFVDTCRMLRWRQTPCRGQRRESSSWWHGQTGSSRQTVPDWGTKTTWTCQGTQLWISQLDAGLCRKSAKQKPSQKHTTNCCDMLKLTKPAATDVTRYEPPSRRKAMPTWAWLAPIMFFIWGSSIASRKPCPHTITKLSNNVHRIFGDWK